MFQQMEIIQILLKEYDALRAEILKRIGHRFIFLNMFGVVGGYALLNYNNFNYVQLIVLAASIIALFSVWWQLGNIIARCSNRIAEIEVAINTRVGESLLKWENEKLGSKTFHKVHK